MTKKFQIEDSDSDAENSDLGSDSNAEDSVLDSVALESVLILDSQGLIRVQHCTQGS